METSPEQIQVLAQEMQSNALAATRAARQLAQLSNPTAMDAYARHHMRRSGRCLKWVLKQLQRFDRRVDDFEGLALSNVEFLNLKRQLQAFVNKHTGDEHVPPEPVCLSIDGTPTTHYFTAADHTQIARSGYAIRVYWKDCAKSIAYDKEKKIYSPDQDGTAITVGMYNHPDMLRGVIWSGGIYYPDLQALLPGDTTAYLARMEKHFAMSHS